MVLVFALSLQQGLVTEEYILEEEGEEYLQKVLETLEKLEKEV